MKIGIGLGRGLSAVVVSVWVGVAGANYADDSESLANAAITKQLESAIKTKVIDQEISQFGYSMYQQGTNYGSSGQESVSGNPEIEIYNKHVNAYCSPSLNSEVTGLKCTSRAVSGEDPKSLELGDMRFSVIIEPITYTTMGELNAKNLIRNLVTPFPSSKFAGYLKNPQLMESNSKNKREYAQFIVAQSKLGVALNSFNEMYFIRTKGSSLGASGDASGKSLLQVVEDEATRRYLDPAFAAYVNDATTLEPALLRELVIMQSFQMWMQYQTYRQNERIEALLATMLANDVNKDLSQITVR